MSHVIITFDIIEYLPSDFNFDEYSFIISSENRGFEQEISYINQNQISHKASFNKKDLIYENDDYDIDFESMNLIFTIATNLYKINEYGNKPRIFLQENLCGTPIFNEFNFWKNIIRYFIINEMHTQKNYNLYENNDIKEKKNEKLIKNKINSFIYHMKAFEVKDKIINDIIIFFQNYY